MQAKQADHKNFIFVGLDIFIINSLVPFFSLFSANFFTDDMCKEIK